MRYLDITTTKNCPVNCYPYCPRKVFYRAYKGAETLTMEGFGRVMDHTSLDVMLGFVGFNEPFLNPQAIDMMEVARDNGFRIRLGSTLVGLKPADIDRLAKIPLSEFLLHLPDPKGVAHIKLDENYKETLMEVLTKMEISGVSIMNGHFKDNFRAGNSDNAPVFHFKGPFRCPIFESPELMMLPDGRVVVCCMDWGLKHVLGSIFTTPYDGLVKSDEFRRVSENRWAFDGDVLCRSCTVPTRGRYLPAFMARKLAYEFATRIGAWPK